MKHRMRSLALPEYLHGLLRVRLRHGWQGFACGFLHSQQGVIRDG